MNQIEIHNSSWKLKFEKAGGSVKKKTSSIKSKVMERNRNVIDSSEPVVFLLIDVSGSMSGDPLDYAKKGAVKFAKDAHAKGYKVGIISFGCVSQLVAKPSRSLRTLSKKIRSLEIDGSTNMTDALMEANDFLKAPLHRHTSVVLVTDGYPDDPEDALDEAMLLKERKVNILTLGTEDADFDFLKLLATSDQLARSVSTEKLISGITSMAKLLPNS